MPVSGHTNSRMVSHRVQRFSGVSAVDSDQDSAMLRVLACTVNTSTKAWFTICRRLLWPKKCRLED